MNGDEKLASIFLSAHPEVAARLLESMDVEHAGQVLNSTSADVAAAVLGHMLPTFSARCAERLAAESVAALLERLPSLAAAALLRHFPPTAREEALRRVTPARKAALNLVLRYPSTSVGAWMEPRVLTFSYDYTIGDALEQLERAGQTHPRIFVLDRSRKLRGAVRIPALHTAAQRGLITGLLEPIQALWARESLAAAQGRDIWEKESEAPVVNRKDEFVGVVAYTDLRKGYRQLVRPPQIGAATQDVGEITELFLSGLESAWQSLGEIIRSEQQERER